MESPAIARSYAPSKSKKRAFMGGSSMDPDVIEIPPPPVNRSSKSKALKFKEVFTTSFQLPISHEKVWWRSQEAIAQCKFTSAPIGRHLPSKVIGKENQRHWHAEGAAHAFVRK